MVMPSDTPTVLYCHASMLSCSMCFLISLPSPSTASSQYFLVCTAPTHRCGSAGAGRYWMRVFESVDLQCVLHDGQYYDATSVGETHLHGLPSHHTLAIPTCGYVFMASLLGTPAAYSIACNTSQFRYMPTSVGRCTWAPGKLWPVVSVDDHLFSAGVPSSFLVPSGRCGKLRKRGSSGSRCFSRLLGSIVDVS